MTETVENLQAESSQSESQNQISQLSNKKLLLPEGTYHPEQSKKINLYKQILKCMKFENLTLPISSTFCQCVIFEEQVGLGNQPIFHLFEEASRKRLLSAQKQINNIGSNFIISKSEVPCKDSNFVGKVRGNFLNDEFFLYDGGQNPNKNTDRKRKQLGFIVFEDESIFKKEVAKLSMIIPKPVETPESTFSHRRLHPKAFIPKQEKQNLLLEESRRKTDNTLTIRQGFMESRDTARNKQQRNLIEQANMEVSLESLEGEEVLKLKRMGQKTYALNVGSPLNFIQAFGFSLALLQRLRG